MAHEEPKGPQYPKAKYHATESVRVVKDEKEEKSLGHGWHDNPNHVNNPPEVEAEPTEQAAAPELPEDEEEASDDSPDRVRRGRPPKHK